MAIMIVIFLLPYKSWSQKEVDFQKMKAMFEQRRPQLDTMQFGPDEFNLPYLSLRTITSDGINISSWFIPNSEQKGTILMVHGFDMNKSGMLSRANHFYKSGYSVLMPDLRARGESGGEKANTGAGNAPDIVSVYNFYKKHLSGYGEITFYGYSHGGRAIIFGTEVLKTNEDIILESPPYYLMKGFQRQYKIDLPMKIDEAALREGLPLRNSEKYLFSSSFQRTWYKVQFLRRYARIHFCELGISRGKYMEVIRQMRINERKGS